MAEGSLRLSARARRTFLAHVFKAVAFQHHRELIPILRPLLPPDGVVLDVGAHAGQMAKLFAGLVPRGHVYAFEPGAYALAVLRPAVRFRGHGRITVEPMGLGSEPGSLTITTPIKRSGSYGFGLSHLGADGPEGAYRHEVSIETVDRFVADHGLKRVDFIKADIEGWEMRMVAGAVDTLSRLRPVLMLEVVDLHLARAGDTRARLWETLTGYAYRPYRIEGGLSPLEAEADGDIVWIPVEKAGS